jgi:hypothetical protein
MTEQEEDFSGGLAFALVMMIAMLCILIGGR